MHLSAIYNQFKTDKLYGIHPLFTGFLLIIIIIIINNIELLDILLGMGKADL